MAKFIEVKYRESFRLVNIDAIAYVKPAEGSSLNTIIKLSCTTDSKGGQTLYCDDDYETFITRLQELTDIRREG